MRIRVLMHEHFKEYDNITDLCELKHSFLLYSHSTIVAEYSKGIIYDIQVIL